ncbi:MAG TPA: MFS transporter [Gemmataceae bacterium]|nr:MFS transporter [Gemmataceae bacterium]
MSSARLRLASLWVSQAARVLADWCLRWVAFLEWAGPGRQASGPAWHAATAVFIAPFLLLAPLNGPLCNGLPRRAVLAGSALFTLAAVAAFAAAGGPWTVCLGVVALGAAVYSPARYALLPAAAVDSRIPLPRVNGWVEMGGAAAIVGGIALGWSLPGAGWPGDGLHLAGRAVAVLLGLNVLSFLTALPVSFPSDVVRPEPPGRAVADFFCDCARIARRPVAAPSLLGLAAFQAVVTAGSGALAAHLLVSDFDGPRVVEALALVGAGAAAGCLAAGLQGHPRRSLGLVPFGATGLLAALGWAALAAHGGAVLPLAPCFLLGFTGGLVNVPLRAAYLAAVPADARGNATAVMNTAIYALTSLLALLMLGLTRGGLLPTPFAQLGFLAALAGAGVAVAWRALATPAFEQGCELLLVPTYRVRALGPGRDRVPTTGPLLIVANHAAYLDPFWLCKCMPRHVTPMMTSVFYDLPVVRWLMVHVVRAIRVPAATFRREAPELRDAVAVLRRGGCVLIFPEGILRRRADVLLRPFGQGVWHVLQELPDTPVLVCWIEGGWGSFASYDGGPPLKGKWPDLLRRIDVGVGVPAPLPAEVLADQKATRAWLMHACLECRRCLGLEVPDAGKLGEADGPKGPDAAEGADVRPINP